MHLVDACLAPHFTSRRRSHPEAQASVIVAPVKSWVRNRTHPLPGVEYSCSRWPVSFSWASRDASALERVGCAVLNPQSVHNARMTTNIGYHLVLLISQCYVARVRYR